MKFTFQNQHTLRACLLLVLMGIAPLLSWAQVQQNAVLQQYNEDQWAGLSSNCGAGYVSIATTNSYPNFGVGIEMARFAATGNIAVPFTLYSAPLTTGVIFEARDIQAAPATTTAPGLPAGYFIVGVSRPSGGASSSMLYIRTDCNGTVLWSKVHTNPNLMKEEGVACVAMSTGDSYYVGKIQPTSAAGNVMYVARFNAAGGLTWGNQYQCNACTATGTCSIIPREACLDVTAGSTAVQAAANQGIAVTGESTTGTPNIPGMQAFISVINSAGTEVWRNAFYTNANYSGSAGYDIVQNTAQGNKLTVVGRANQIVTGATTSLPKIYVFQTTSFMSTVAGATNLLWADIISSTNANLPNTYGRAIEVSVSNSANYVLAGPDFQSGNGTTFLMEVTPSASCTSPLNVVWARSYPNTIAHQTAPEDIQRLPNGYYVNTHSLGATPTAFTTDMFELFTDITGNTPSCPIITNQYSVIPTCGMYALAKCKSTDVNWTTPQIVVSNVSPTENACPVSCGTAVTFTDSIDCATRFFTSNVTGCPAGSIVSYNWNFGDGTTSTVANPSHSYATVGTYNVCLTVVCTSPTGLSCTAVSCRAITVSNVGATTDFCYTVNSNLKSVLISGVTTTGCTGTVTYSWDFGDGSPISTAVTPPTRTYATGGTYTVCVVTKCTVNGQTCCTRCCKTIEVPNPCPTFFPTFTYTIPASGLGVLFTPTAGIVGYTYSWTFTDALGATIATSAIRNPTIIFPNYGTYTACLTVNYGTGAGAICTKYHCKSVVIPTNTGCALNANFKYISCTSTTPGTVGNAITFTSTSTGVTSTSTVYAWDFGDGSTGTGANPTHAYATPGNYMVCLTISDGTGNCYSRVCITINVGPKTCNSANCTTGMRVMHTEDGEVGEPQEAGDYEARMQTDDKVEDFRIFPNPTDNLLNIEAKNGFMQGSVLSISNVMGDTMYEKVFGAEVATESVDMSSFSSGIYLISIKNMDGTTITRKVVKE